MHGLASILLQGKRAYSRHPEAQRWVGCGSGLARRHAQLVAEMALRGYQDWSPLATGGAERWPPTFVTPPHEQYELLRMKYSDKPNGRIPLPRSAHELWAQHKYSMMARDRRATKSSGGGWPGCAAVPSRVLSPRSSPACFA